MPKAFFLLIAAVCFPLWSSVARADSTLLNASYDVAREFYAEFNPQFAQYWHETSGEKVTVNQSHGGSSKQARSVADGLAADVVTLNQATDLDFLASKGLIARDWSERFPSGASPFTSTIVFVVRKGNPKQIKNWDDLVKPGVSVIIANPKTSGNGRYSYLAAWGYARKASGNDDKVAKDFVTRLFKNAPVLDTGGRAATTTFAQRRIGDVLLTFENEAYLAQREFGADKLEIVTPSVSILAELPVAVVEPVVEKHGTRKLAEEYLHRLYSPGAQSLAVKHFLRPRDPEILAKSGGIFPAIELLGISEIAGGWTQAQQTHFADGGLFDQIYLK
ncbi:MAG TPA: sulfate ABC transporter substrate-binding protein [Chthoniobacter sp.]|nr:sulfate ABC transporter substrate-binding protein [Chthoniobacter sp.]